MNMPLIYSVEDDESIRELLECTMDASGFRIVTFPDAESMLNRLEQKKCDLILMDIMLPHMDGIEALKHVKAKYSDLPVILLSAKGSSVITGLTPQAAAKKIKLETELSDVIMSGDAEKFTELIQNLVDNSIKYSGKDKLRKKRAEIESRNAVRV